MGNDWRCKSCGFPAAEADFQCPNCGRVRFAADAASLTGKRKGAWVAWYFKRGFLTFLTVPLFLFLVYCLVVSVMGAVVQGWGLLVVSYAVFGYFGAFLSTGGWILVILPPGLYYSLLKNLPGLWLRPDGSPVAKLLFTVALLIVFPGIAYFIYQGITIGIAWVADQNPCAALAAGVTGTVMPVDCP